MYTNRNNIQVYQWYMIYPLTFSLKLVPNAQFVLENEIEWDEECLWEDPQVAIQFWDSRRDETCLKASHTKWQSISMCLVRLEKIGLAAMWKLLHDCHNE